MTEDLIERLQLARSPGIGPVTFRQLMARFGTASAALAAIPDLATRGGGRAPRLHGRSDAEREIARVEKLGARFLVLGQGLYPRLLAELDDAPPLLIVKGAIGLLDKLSVAIVGARNASAAACRFARGLAHELGQDDVVIVSGLARGIDSAAHDELWKPARSESSLVGSTSSTPRKPRAPRGIVRTRACGSRDAARDRAESAALSLS